MRKNRLVTVFLVFAMLLAFMLPASASATDNASITLVAPTSLTLNADDFAAYQLFTVTTSGSGDATSYAYLPVQPAVDNFLAWANGTAQYNGASPYGTTAAEFKTYLGNIEDNAPELTKLTEDLKDSGKFSAVGSASVANVANPSGVDTHSEVTISDLNYGYYLIAGAGTAPGEGAATNTVTAHSALLTLDSQNSPCKINLKADAPSISKQVWDHSGSGGWGHWTDANIGDTVSFQFTSAVPDVTGYSSYTYVVHDTLDQGFTLDPNFDATSVTATIGADPFTGFTVGVDGQNLTITFDTSSFKDHIGDTILISYSATLNDKAKIAPDGNDNVVWLEYSNNPYDCGAGGSTGKTPHSRVRVYTYDLELYKYEGTAVPVDSPGSPLAGAVFNLRTTEGDASSAVKFRLVTPGTDIDPAVYVVDPGENGSVDTTTPASGLIRFVGLDAGTYYLYEKQAPDGYNILQAETKAVIKPKNLYKGTAPDYIATVDYDTPVVDIANNKGGLLPHTGGMGTVLFYMIGTVLTVGLAGFFIIRRRRNLLSLK